MADRVSVLILSTDLPEADIAIEKARVRERFERLYPGKLELFEMIYESRWRRLWEQFRGESDGSDGSDESD